MKYFSEKILQKKYLDKIFENCETLSGDYDFYVVSSHPNQSGMLDLPEDNKPKVVFDLADEWHRVPFYYGREDVKLIAKEYAPFDYQKYDKIIPLPTFYNYDDSEYKEEDYKKESVLFLSMWETPSRKKLKNVLSQYEDADGYEILWNDKFGSGYPVDVYNKKSKQSLISICPNGYMSPEVSKVWESILNRNIIITTPRPNFTFYEDNKFFIYHDESEIPEIINQIISLEPEKIQSILDGNQKLFDKNVSPEGVSKIIKNKLKDLK